MEEYDRFNIHLICVFIDNTYAPPNVDSQVYFLFFVSRTQTFSFSSLDCYNPPFLATPI